jgi:hypothetical protein
MGALFALLVGFASACGSDDDGTSPSPVEMDASDTSCPVGTPPFEFGPSGLSATDKAMTMKVYLEEASDKPPLYGTNDWTIQITDMMGAPMPAAKLTWACAFMPLHGHGSNPKTVTDLGDGKYELVKQNMAMQGGWEIRLWVDPTGAGTTYTGGGSSINKMACSEPGTVETFVLQACVPR